MDEVKPITKQEPSRFDIDDDSYEWLELPKIPDVIRNPFFEKESIFNNDPTKQVMSLVMDTNYLHFVVKNFLNINLLPYQLVILDTLWNKRLPILLAGRGSGKSFILAVYALLRMILHAGCKIVIVGAGLRQSRMVFDEMTNIWNKAPVLRDVAGNGKNTGPRREPDRYTFEIGDSRCWACPLGDGQKIRGLRAHYVLADEFASINEEIFNVVVQGFAVVQAEPFEKVKHIAVINALKRTGRWTDEHEVQFRKEMGGNQIIRAGTAFFAFNHFYKTFKLWHQIISSKGDKKRMKEMLGDDKKINEGFEWKDYAILRIPYTHVAEGMLDPAIIAQAKVSLSKSQFDMEFCAIFARDSNGFFRRSVLEAATTNKPITLQTGEVVQFRAQQAGDFDKAHVIAIDPAADQDNAAIVVLELNQSHRKIVYCWTTNKKKHSEYKKLMQERGVKNPDDYYRYIAKKIREIMRSFKTERIVMDKNGGGTAIMEAIGSPDTCLQNELPIYTIIDEDNPKFCDSQDGLHILEMLAPTNDINAEANHGMLKDFQDKILLFPMFDTIELARAIELDNIDEKVFDTYEDIVNEIEELKNEITSIVVTPSSVLGKETFNTPSEKGSGSKAGYLRKDRYSALLYANLYARNRDKKDVFSIQYNVVGASSKDTSVKVKKDGGGEMYTGIGAAKFKGNSWMGGMYSGNFIKH